MTKKYFEDIKYALMYFHNMRSINLRATLLKEQNGLSVAVDTRGVGS